MKKLNYLIPISFVILVLSGVLYSQSTKALTTPRCTYSKFEKVVDTLVIMDPVTYKEEIKINSRYKPVSLPSECIPEIRMAGSKGSKISVSKIEMAKGLELANNMECTDTWRIESYDIVYVAPLQDARIEFNEGAAFSDPGKVLIHKAKRGDKFLFESILLVNKNGDMAAGNDLILTVD